MVPPLGAPFLCSETDDIGLVVRKIDHVHSFAFDLGPQIVPELVNGVEITFVMVVCFCCTVVNCMAELSAAKTWNLVIDAVAS